MCLSSWQSWVKISSFEVDFVHSASFIMFDFFMSLIIQYQYTSKISSKLQII